MPHKPATRALAVGSSFVVFIVITLGLIGFSVWGTADRAQRNTEILRQVCEVINRQNRVLLRFSDLVNNPIPVPPGAGHALAEAITNRNAHLAEGAEYAKEQTKPANCVGPSKEAAR